MHDGMQCDPIKGQGQGHEPLKVGNSAILKAISFPIYNGGWQMTTDSAPDFSFCPSFCVT